MKVALAAAVASVMSIGMAAPAQAFSDQQRNFVADVTQRGVNGDSVMNDATQQTLGDAVCSDLNKGTPAENEVNGVARAVMAVHGSMPQAEVIVYWAITDLCPDQMNQRQDQWRDGQ